MDIYCSIDEQYIQATEELKYGEIAKALQLFNALIATQANYARAYFQLGIINYYHIKDYQAAGYFFSQCIETEPSFPDAYEDFIKLLVFLNMEKKAKIIAAQALDIAGINQRLIYQQLGFLEEKGKRWTAAINYYNKAYYFALEKEDIEDSKTDIERVKDKISKASKFVYHYEA